MATASSRLTSRTDDNGNTTSYSYDPLNRLVNETNADGTASPEAGKSPIFSIDSCSAHDREKTWQIRELSRCSHQSDFRPGVDATQI